MKNVIAYSLWGDHPIYWKGALENIKQANKYFPGWICRFYIDKNCKSELINSIIGDNVHQKIRMLISFYQEIVTLDSQIEKFQQLMSGYLQIKIFT